MALSWRALAVVLGSLAVVTVAEDIPCVPGQIKFISDYKNELVGTGCDAYVNDTSALAELGTNNDKCVYTSEDMDIEHTRYSHVDIALVAAEAATHTESNDGVKIYLRYDARPFELVLELKGDFSADMCEFYPWWSGCTQYGFFASFDALEQPAGFAKTVTIRIELDNVKVHAADEAKIIALKDVAVLGLCSQVDHTADNEGEYKYDAETNKAIPTPAPTPHPTSVPTAAPTQAPTTPTPAPTALPTFEGIPTKSPTTARTTTHEMRETDHYTSTCQHVHCERKVYPDGSTGGLRVHHNNDESYGSKHSCKYNLHVAGKCGCECFDEAVGFDIDLPALDYDPDIFDGGGWTEILSLNIPTSQNWDRRNDVPYDRSRLGEPYIPADHKMVKVAYLLELDTEYVWISFDETSLNHTGVPVDYHIDGYVNNTNIYSNRATGIVPGTNLPKSKVEFWNHCYNPAGGNSKLYDHDDSWIAGMTTAHSGNKYEQRFCYGSMQFHQNQNLVMGFNGWSYPSKCDIEIGYDHKGVHPDGTFNDNCDEHHRKRMTVMIRTVKRNAPCSPGWVATGTSGECVENTIPPTPAPTLSPTSSCGGHLENLCSEHINGFTGCKPGHEQRPMDSKRNITQAYCFRCGEHLDQPCQFEQTCVNGTEPRLNPTTGTDHCYSCGGHLQANCTMANKEKCDMGNEARANGLCYTCGAHGQETCNVGDQCATGTEARGNPGLCYTCGGQGKEPCIVTGAETCAPGLTANTIDPDFMLIESCEVEIIGGEDADYIGKLATLIKSGVEYQHLHLLNNYNPLYVTSLEDAAYQIIVGHSYYDMMGLPTAEQEKQKDSVSIHGTPYKFTKENLRLVLDKSPFRNVFTGQSEFARGQAPWLQGADNIQPSLAACKAQCNSILTCRYATYRSDVQQCWLSETTPTVPVKCATQGCHSFDRIATCQ